MRSNHETAGKIKDNVHVGLVKRLEQLEADEVFRNEVSQTLFQQAQKIRAKGRSTNRQFVE